MKFANHTPFPAAHCVGSTGELEQLVTVACKATYGVTPDGGLSPLDAEQAWPINEGPAQFAGQLLASDLDFRAQGIDLLLFGEAQAPQAQPVAQMRMGARCGALVFAVDVLGERHWERAAGSGDAQALCISPPQPFLTMPLDCQHAFGGQALYQGTQIPYGANPLGKGFIVDPAEAPGTPLPNLERSDMRIAHWQDRPVPACFHKPPGLLLPAQGEYSAAALEAQGSHSDALLRAVLRYAFNSAVPDLICRSGQLGADLELFGFAHAGKLRLPLPAERGEAGVQGPVAYASIGGQHACFPLSIASLVVLVAHRVLIVTWRASFRYLFRATQRRSLALAWYGPVDVLPRAQRAA